MHMLMEVVFVQNALQKIRKVSVAILRTYAFASSLAALFREFPRVSLILLQTNTSYM